MPAYEFSPSVDGVDYNGNYGVADKIAVVVTDNGYDNAYANNVRLSGAYSLFPSATPDGNDALSISASVNTSMLTASAQLNYNSLAGGNGDNKLSLVANGNALSGIVGNSLSATDGKDSFTLTAKTKGGFSLVESAVIGENSIMAGDGANKITMKAETTGDDAYIGVNSVVSGEGKDSLSFSLKTAGNDGGASGADALFQANSLLMGDGANQIKVDTQTGGDDAGILLNSIVGGDSTDKLTFSAKTAGKVPAEIGGSEYRNADAYFSANTLLTGDGKDSIKITAQSGNDDAVLGYNSINMGEANDSLSVTLKTSAKGPIADTGGATVYTFVNSIDLGDGDDKLSIKAQTSGDDIGFYNNLFNGGEGNDKIQINLKTSGKAPDAQGNGADTVFSYNTLRTESGKDEVKIQGQTGGDDAVFSINSLYASGEDSEALFDINFKTSGKDPGTNGNGINVYFDYNSLIGGAYESRFKFSGQTTGDDATFFGNSLLASGYSTHLDVTMKTTGKLENTADLGFNGADAVVGNNSITASNSYDGTNEFSFDVQSGGDDALFIDNQIDIGQGTLNHFDIKLKTSGKSPSMLTDTDYDGGDASFNANSLFSSYSSSYGDTTLTAKIESGGDDATFDMNTLSSNYGNDLSVTAEVKTTGKSEDFGGADASISNNSLHSVYRGTFLADFTADSKNGDTSIDDNRFSGSSDGFQSISDTLSFTAKAGKAGVASISDNDLYMGQGQDILDLNLAAKGTGEFMDNTINLGNGDDQLTLDLSAKDSLTFTGNRITSQNSAYYGGSADDEIILKIKAAEGSDLSGNTFRGEGYDRYDHTSTISLDIDTKLGADEIETFLDGNTFNGGNHIFDTLSFVNKGQMIDLADVADNLNRIDHLALGKKSTLTIDSAQNVIDSSKASYYNYTTHSFETTYNLLVSGKGSTVDIDTGLWTNDGAVEYQGYQTTHFSNGMANLYVADGVDVI